MCDTEILTVPPPHSSCWLNQPSYSLLEADCKELNCFHMSSARTVCSLWQPLLHPAAAATCVFPTCARVRVCVCMHECVGVCTHMRVLVTPELCPHHVRETNLSLLGEIQSSFFPLLSFARHSPRTMSNNVQLRRMQINLSLHSPAMQLAAHLRDTKLVYTWYTKNAD